VFVVGPPTVKVNDAPDVSGVTGFGEKPQVGGADPIQVSVTELLYPAAAVSVPFTIPV
jgi:hypothetical protein